MDLHLRGMRVLITGASKGIGAAAAKGFAEEGCDLHLAARDGSALETLAAQLRLSHGVNVVIDTVDLRKADDIERLASAAAQSDILVNNAGDIPSGTLDKIDEAAWRHAWELKVFGYINLTRRIYADMKARRHGVVINVIGLAGERFDAQYIAGSTGNAALMGFTRSLGGASLADGIRVVGINPGAVATDRMVILLKANAKSRFGDENRFQELTQNLPSGRAAAPEEIANAMLFLASDRSAYTSGVILTIDGGLGAGRYSV